MKSTLIIKDLALELDRKAMSAVRGGYDNQAIAEQQANGQAALVGLNVANGSKFCGPTNIQSHSNVDQTAYNDQYSDNFKAFGFEVPM